MTENDIIRKTDRFIVSAGAWGFECCDYDVCTLRIKKVIRVHASGACTRKFRNIEIFGKVDAGEGLRRLNSSKSLAGTISMPCGALRFIHMTRRVVTPVEQYRLQGQLLHERVPCNPGVFDFHGRFS